MMYCRGLDGGFKKIRLRFKFGVCGCDFFWKKGFCACD